ncbi:MAG: hypothetical protein ABI668_01920 [Sphingorhabdus sp.]
MNPTLQPNYYSFGGCEEYCPGIDPGGNATRRILFVAPLFDEMNRTRRMLISTMRALGGRGVSSFLPDLPGANESSAALIDQDIACWQAAMAAAAAQLKVTHIASVRGGSLIDGAMPDAPHWRLMPAKGANLLKTMLRTRVAGDKEMGLTTTSDALIVESAHQPILLAGNWLSPAMVTQLHDTVCADVPHLRSVSIGEGADMIKGSALWLRAEPQDDPDMAQALAADLDRWSASCGA